MPVAIPLIGAAAGIGGSLIASGSAKSAASDAASEQAAANQAAIAEQQRQYDQTRTDLLPFQTAGTNALGAQGDLLGINGGTAQQSAIDSLKNSPLYQSLFNTGQETLLQNASATGGLRGGNTQGALAQFGSTLLGQTIQQQIANLSGVATQGEDAAAKTGAIGAGSANDIASLLSGSGTAAANASLIGGAANAGSASSIASTLAGLTQNQALLKALTGGGGSSSLASDAANTIAANPSIF